MVSSFCSDLRSPTIYEAYRYIRSEIGEHVTLSRECPASRHTPILAFVPFHTIEFSRHVLWRFAGYVYSYPPLRGLSRLSDSGRCTPYGSDVPVPSESPVPSALHGYIRQGLIDPDMSGYVGLT